MIQLHTKAPTFSLADQDGVIHTLEQYGGKKVLLYFYPKDDTPGCTTEACNFRDGYKAFQEMGIVILGVSADTVTSHKNFANKFNLPFPLLSDESHAVCEAYGVWGLKKFLGKEYLGIERSSFLINEKGLIEKIYEKVKPQKHATEITTDINVAK